MNNIQIDIKVKKINKIDLSDIWYFKEDEIIECESVYGEEHFYPLYSWKNYYSYSILKLLKLKGGVDFNRNLIKYLKNDLIVDYLPPDVNVDLKVRRIGGPLKSKKSKIFSKNSFLEKFSQAMIEDVRFIESIHPEAIIGILVGGKDSLNILLLPWKNKVVAFSANPNFELVKEFCKINNLDIEVVQLNDYDKFQDKLLDFEILSNSFRIGLQDVRWVYNLKCLKEFYLKELSRELVIITGSLGDTFLTPYFKKYTSKWNSQIRLKFLRKFRVWKHVFFQNSWDRGAQWQGIYHGILRECTSLNNYSIYHGRNVLKILSIADLEKIIDEDIRDDLGKTIFGKEVFYPLENPSPKVWSERLSNLTLNNYLNLLRNKI